MKDKSTHKTANGAVEFLKLDGLTSSDPAMLGGSPIKIRPYRGHDGIVRILPDEHAADILISDEAGDLSQTKSENFKLVAFYDPVRDVQPRTPSGPTPETNPEAIRLGDPWIDQGDNGIESYPGKGDLQRKRLENCLFEQEAEEEEEQKEALTGAPAAKVIQRTQLADPSTGFGGATDINKIGQTEAEQPLEPLRKPTDLDIHLVVNHYLQDNPTFYPIDQIKDFHLSLHMQGQSDHNPEVLRLANILDPIQETLDAKIWDNPASDEPRLKSTISAWVKQVIFTTLKNNNYKNPEDWIKLIITGSLTTYQWSEQSDLDVSIWVDINNFPDFDRSEMIKAIIENLDGDLVPGTSHPIQCFVVDVNQIKSPEEIYKSGVRSAYNLDTHEWIVKPERERSKHVPSAFPDFFRKARMASGKMALLLKYQPQAAKTYWHFLHKRRREDMKAGLGDYSESNIVYKMLANDGLFKDIADATGEYIA